MPQVVTPEYHRRDSVHSRLHPLDTSISSYSNRRGAPDPSSARSSHAEPLPSVSQLLATTPIPGLTNEPLSGSAVERRFDSMLQSPASDRSSALSGRAPISDLLSTKLQASPRNPYVSFPPQFLSPASEMERRQSAPVHQRSPAHLSTLNSTPFGSIVKREPTPMMSAKDGPPVFKNPFPEPIGQSRVSHSISPQYTPSPRMQPNSLQASGTTSGPYPDSSRTWTQLEVHPARNFSHRPPLSQSSSQSAFSNTEFLDTSRPGPYIRSDDKWLPRFLREEYLPNEGLCYFYDDGTHCPAVIHGEQVNPYWGVTKAGKPRRRLFLACQSCRDKKIKCEPGYPKCAQCDKFGRECRFTAV